MTTRTTTNEVPPIVIDLVSPVKDKKQRFSDRTRKSRIEQTSRILLSLNVQLKKRIDKNNPKLAKHIENIKNRIRTYENYLDEILSSGDD